MVSVHPDENTEPGIQLRVYRNASVHPLAEERDIAYPQDTEVKFTLLYDKYYSYAFSLAKAFIGIEDAGDIVAVVFSRLWMKRTDLKKIENFKGYIAASIRNACLDHLGQESNRRKKVLDYSDYFSGMPDDEYLTEEIQAEKLHRIYSEVEKLPKRCQQIFKLAFFEGLKNSEIASMLGISSRNVLNQKSYALKTIRLRIASIILFILLRVFP
jgi:RNA polymerase sigma-70 factor (family 1)